MGFINRGVEFPNKKKLIIKEVSRDNDGEIESLVVEEEREEGIVYVAGTALEASTLQEIIQGMIATTLSQ